MDRIDSVEQVGVVKHNLGGFLGEIFANGINHVQQTSISEILDIVHDRCPRSLDILRQLRHIRCLRTFLSQLIEELLYLCQVFQFYLLDEQDIYLGHHIHGFQQILGVVAMLLEEGVEAMMDIILEIAARRYLWQYLLDNAIVVP